MYSGVFIKKGREWLPVLLFSDEFEDNPQILDVVSDSLLEKGAQVKTIHQIEQPRNYFAYSLKCWIRKNNSKWKNLMEVPLRDESIGITSSILQTLKDENYQIKEDLVIV